MRVRSVTAGILLACLVAACSSPSSEEPRDPEPTPSKTARPSAAQELSEETPSPSATAPAWLDDWELGARVLPLRADGYGQRRPTPPELRVRRMPTVDVLPPPRGEEYVASVRRISPEIRDRMGTTWRPGCPVGLRDLRYLRVTFHGFDREPHTGELIVHEDHARGIVQVFRTLYDARFPIEQMTLPTTVAPDPTPSGDGNGTGAMVCRPTTGASTLSAHAYGLAVDVNPFQNPYINDGLLLPELAGAYLDRSWRRPGMIHPDGVVVRAFAEIGWSWGGNFQSLKDYHHFSATGR